MREIKFDAIYKPTGEHFTPNTLDFVNNIVTGDFDGEVNDWCYFSLDGKRGDAILRQFAGLKDKNNKEIYEGNILSIRNVVTYVDGSDPANLGMAVGWYMQRDNFESWAMLEVGDELEVIGDIYHNPELLSN